MFKRNKKLEARSQELGENMNLLPSSVSRLQASGSSHSRGFTLIELLVSVGIFVAMTALFVVKYGTFNQNVLLTNLAYDVALTIRTAQTYGLSIKGTGGGTGGGSQADLAVFQNTYGVAFSSVAPLNARMILFSSPISKPPKTPDDYIFSHDGNDNPGVGDAVISKFLLKRGAVISRLCAGPDKPGCVEVQELSVNFKRPDPAATICAGADSTLMSCLPTDMYAEIDVRSTDGNVRTVQIRGNGQISVLD